MHTLASRVAFCAIALSGSLACSSTAAPPVSVADSGAAEADSAVADAQADSPSLDAAPNPECNSVAQLGKVVNATFSKALAPSPTGGTTVDGTYVLTAIVAYGAGGPFDFSLKSTLEAKGLVVNVVEDNGTGNKRKTGSGVVSNTTLTLTETCAFPKRRLLVEQASFTATATEISLYGQVGATTVVQTYTKQ